MPSFNYNLTIEQGATFDKTMTWKTGTPSLPVDLTGATAKCQFRAPDNTLLGTVQTLDGTLVLGGTAGTIRFLIPAATTLAYSWTNAANYDVLITFANGTVTRFLAGTVTLLKSITQ